jgi:hypothetical protein
MNPDLILACAALELVFPQMQTTERLICAVAVVG